MTTLSRKNMIDRGDTESKVADTINMETEYPAYPSKLVSVSYVQKYPVTVVVIVITRYEEWREGER